MTCVECGAAIPTPTTDPFRCPRCRVAHTICGCDWPRLSPCPDHAALLTDAEASALEQVRLAFASGVPIQEHECPVCGVTLADAADVARDIDREYVPTATQEAEGRAAMRHVAQRLLERANERAG